MPDTPTSPDAIEAARAAVEATAAEIIEIRQLLGTKLTTIRQQIIAADRLAGGKGRNELVRRADGGLSRPKVFEVLGVADLESDIHAALKDCGTRYHLTRPGGKIHLELDVDEYTPDWPEPDEYGDEPDEEERAQRKRAAWIGAANAAGGIQHLLRQAGLTLTGLDPQDALANGQAVEVVRQPSFQRTAETLEQVAEAGQEAAAKLAEAGRKTAETMRRLMDAEPTTDPNS